MNPVPYIRRYGHYKGGHSSAHAPRVLSIMVLPSGAVISGVSSFSYPLDDVDPGRTAKSNEGRRRSRRSFSKNLKLARCTFLSIHLELPTFPTNHQRLTCSLHINQGTKQNSSLCYPLRLVCSDDLRWRQRRHPWRRRQPEHYPFRS